VGAEVTNTVSKTVSDETLNCIITIESGGKLTAKASTSSALGLGQFLNSTWIATVKKHRPDLFDGRNEAQVLALRTSPQLAVELLARFTEDNQHAIGMNCTGGDLYLAHFLGAGDAKDLFRADPDTLVSHLVSAGAIAANRSVLLGKTAGQVRAWAAKRMHESTGHNWVAKYYQPPKPIEESPPPSAEPEPEPIPDTQTAPEGPPAAEPAPPVSVPAEGGSWLKRKWKGITGALSGFLGLSGAAVFDWRIVVALSAVVFIFAVAIILFMGPADVRSWIRRQVA
jgi:hypothetical protein